MLSYLNLSIDHNCTYSQFSKSFPDVEISIWCKDSYDIIVLKKGIDKFDVIKEYIEKNIGNISHFYITNSVAHMILKECYCVTTPLVPIYKDYHSIDIPPILYRNGKELIRLIIVTDEIDLLLDKLHTADDELDLEIISVNHLKKSNLEFPFYIALSDVIKGLTKRQFKSLILAFQNGYYKIPREKTIKELAQQLNINRKTFEEHLRKSENKIMKNIIPALIFSQEEPDS